LKEFFFKKKQKLIPLQIFFFQKLFSQFLSLQQLNLYFDWNIDWTRCFFFWCKNSNSN